MELEGPPSCGKGYIVDQMIASMTLGGSRVSYVDLPRTFYPPSVAWAGGCLERLLVVRPLALPQALWACELLVRSQGFELIVLDLTVRRPERARAAGSGAGSPSFKTRLDRGTITSPERPEILRAAVQPGAAPLHRLGRVTEQGSSVVLFLTEALGVSTALRLVVERGSGEPIVRVARSRWSTVSSDSA